ncbi:Hypothetical protein LUCI_1133 [Lucifera butyrica]|uniref:Uncharacterized protein n=1 Tax=Lucifera butyrica TaxID=1351585 RepID=A0A498R6M4_9FIRM|nr:GIY-YIG nuclease family protein [Lucifera butyrica]VBB05922.1 Hypothetical protein LUCI_1133 [Lucifera butyrica]
MADRKKELKLAYKQSPPPMGVYQIKNAVNGKILVGSSLNLPGKKNSFLFQLKLGSPINKVIQADLNLHGPDAFHFEVLETIKATEVPEEEWRRAVTALEKKWLDKLQPFAEKGYNTRKKTL